MDGNSDRAIAIVGVGAILPDAPDAATFWHNITSGRYSISDVSPDRWDPALYYDPDPKAPDKTYSKIGGWVREWEWNPLKWGLPIPPRVSDAMDDGQKWAVACTRAALLDYGYPQRALDGERTAVVLGNAMAGEKHYLTALRIYFPEYAEELAAAPSFAELPPAVRAAITAEMHGGVGHRFPEITEDTMPGELSNCIAGRIANLFNFRGPNYVVDAACASAIAAISTAAEGLTEGDYDAVVAGGIDRNMGASSYVKFCKIGALSATGTRPYADGADGFVMGEGAVMFLLKRLADAEQTGDRIYAVLRGIGGSSDGKGKGITAPNPVGQRLAIERAWKNAGLSPLTATLVEGHGTSTRVGDVVEVESLTHVFGEAGAKPASVALGSVKSNIGHLKAAAGAAGLLKAVLAVHEKVLPPSLHFDRPNPNIDFARSPFVVNTELRPWNVGADTVRRAGVSTFGFGGTNFHCVLEEHVPSVRSSRGAGIRVASPLAADRSSAPSTLQSPAPEPRRPLRGALVIGARSAPELTAKLAAAERDARGGNAPLPAPPLEADLRAPERLAIDYTDAKDLADKATKAVKALAVDSPGMWKALRAQGIFRGRGPAPKVAFLYTGQGSQYVNMLGDLRASERVVAETFAEADQVMTPLLGKPLSDYIFVPSNDPAAIAKAEDHLKQTAITQPAVLATDTALTRLLAAFGILPDFVMGHSLGEYGALVAADALPFADALEAVSARGREMTNLSVADNGLMAAVFAPLPEIERILATIEGYVVIANVNSNSQAVIGGASDAVRKAMDAFLAANYNAVPLPVSHAFHTAIVAPASEPLRRTLTRLRLRPPSLPIVANVSGDMYPMGSGVVPEMIDILARQVASPVQFIKGLHTLYDAGARVFIEVGPKKALQGFVDDVFADQPEVSSLFSNHPKVGGAAAFNQALCGLYAAGLGVGTAIESSHFIEASQGGFGLHASHSEGEESRSTPLSQMRDVAAPLPTERYLELGRLFAEFLDRGRQIYFGQAPAAVGRPVVITGAALGLPGTEHVFDEGNVSRILNGEQFIDVIPSKLRHAMLDKHITRLVKSEEGGPHFEVIESPAEVIKLAARAGQFDLGSDFGVSAERLPALDVVTRLAIAAGLDALRDAGIPLVMRYKTTSKGTHLPDRWVLPDALRDDTGIIFASAFPGYDSFAGDLSRYYADHARREQLALLEALRARLAQPNNGEQPLAAEIDHRLHDVRAAIEKEPYSFDRRFLFRILAMGHSQFAELIGARGPNTQLNAACASTTQAVAVAEDWIRAGRCRRVVIVAADDVTTDNLLEWIGAGFLSSGAAATDDVVEDAAIPFDRRRHGMLLGMGAAAMVVECAAAAAERGLRPICEVLSAVTANSAFHGTRLDVEHICQVMETLVAQGEERWGIDRHRIAPHLVFMSHETYTPARGGSAAAEVHALRTVFGSSADQIVVANTKGFTGHPMGVGIEDVVAIKALETGLVPPVANFKELDPELGRLNLSKGGAYPVEYALRLGAGFGSQISMTLIHWVPTSDGHHPSADDLGYHYRIADAATWRAWLSRVSGYDAPDVEVVQRTLRVKDQGPAAAAKAAHSHPSTAMQDFSAPISDEHHTPGAVRQKPDTQPVAEQPVTSDKPAGAPPPTATTDDDVRTRVLALVAEKTGYPPDMLDLDLDLEADLGIDTVKQAEIFATIREAYAIPRDDKLKLRDFPTLAHVIQFVHDRRPETKPRAQERESGAAAGEAVDRDAGARPSSPAPIATTSDEVQERVLALVAEKTGYPPDMLDLDLDLEADLGIDTVKQAEIFATIREAYAIPRDDKLKLRDFPTLAHVIQFVHDRRPETKPRAQERESGAAAGEAVDRDAGARPSSPAPIATTSDEVQERVLALVAEKTGYPPDMLDLDLDLEADLGIDTVKQAEIFATIREAYGIPRDDKLKLRDFPTLAHVIAFMKERRPNAEAGQETIAQGATADDAGVVGETGLEGRGTRPTLIGFDATNAVPRRVPVPILRPPLELCKATGINIGAGSRVVVRADDGGVAKALVKRLKKRGADVLIIEDAPDTETLQRQLGEWLGAGPIQGVYWLPALDAEPHLQEMDLAGWRAALDRRVKQLYATMRTVYDRIASADTFLVAATRLGGQHGYDERGAFAPMGGAVTGFTKAYKREQAAALVKAVDFEPKRKAADIADALLAETERDPGAVEIGYQNALRWTIGLEERSAADGCPGLSLGPTSVFVVTGAAGSIVSAIVADLAAASGGTFYLLDKAPEPDAANSDLARFVSDKEALKRDLFERIRARGERATPALVERELAGLERAHAAHAAIQAVRAAGGVAHYCAVDLLDGAAVARVIDQIRAANDHIDVLVHAAGLEVSRFLPDKAPREFDLVFDVKSDGWFNLLHAIGDLPLGAAVVFSSIAGRFGNGGQTDYSAANDLLCKHIASFRSSRPATRGIAVDWTAWDKIGMAARGSIPKMMEAAGIDMLAPEAGIPVVRRELTAGGTSGEVVIAVRLGVLLDEWDPSGGLDAAAVASRAGGPMIGSVAGMGVHTGLTVETMLDPNRQPFLHDHEIDGTPVLPGVMGIEAFAEIAALLLPGWSIEAIEAIDFVAPFKFYRREPRTVTLHAVFRAAGERVVADCYLSGTRVLANQPGAQVTSHFVGRVRMSPESAPAPTSAPPQPANGAAVTAPDIYRLYFHGPAYQVLERVWRDGARTVGLMAEPLPPNHLPAEAATRMAPRLIELCFQTAGILEMGTTGRMALPQHIDQARHFTGAPAIAGRLYAVVTEGADGGFDAEVVDTAGNVHVTLRGYRTVALPAAIAPEELVPLRQVMA